MYKSAIAHYKNKYRGGMVKASEGSLDVYDYEGEHVVSLQKNGCGQWVDVSDQVGARDRHDFSPLPQNACRFKLYKDGKIAQAEEFNERDPLNKLYSELECGGKGKVPSCEELKASGFKLSDGEPGSKQVDEEQLKKKHSEEQKPKKDEKKS